MTYILRVISTGSAETKKFIFEGENMPSEEVFEKISIGLKGITRSGSPLFRTCESLSEERGLSLTRRRASCSWDIICFYLVDYFAKQFPGAKVLNS